MNYRHLTIYLSILLTLLALVSCGPKEGVVDHRQRIDQIYASEKASLDGQALYEYNNLLAEQWNWDGNELYRIDYQFSTTYSENIFYDGRHRIIRTTVPAYRQRNDFRYDGRQLNYIDCYEADSLVSTIQFVHDGNVLTEIQRYDYRQSSAKIGNLFRQLLGTDLACAIEMGARRHRAQTKGNGTVRTDFHFEWDDDDNVSRVTYNDGTQTQQIVLTYDEMHNPYSELYTSFMMDESIFGFAMMSRHNVVTMRMPYEMQSDLLFTYTYQYEDDYPTSRHLHYSYSSMNETDWTEALYEYDKTEVYSYR